MYNYSDILGEIEVIKDQLELTDNEVELWYFGGDNAHKYGANASLIQVDRLVKSRNNLYDRLKELETARDRSKHIMDNFEGEEYQLAYMRIVKQMTHKEIGAELGYEEQTIRKKWSRMNVTQRQQTG